MTIRASLLSRVQRYRIEHDLSKTAFCRLAGVEKKTVQTLKDGGYVSLRTLERIETFLDDNAVMPSAAPPVTGKVAGDFPKAGAAS